MARAQPSERDSKRGRGEEKFSAGGGGDTDVIGDADDDGDAAADDTAEENEMGSDGCLFEALESPATEASGKLDEVGDGTSGGAVNDRGRDGARWRFNRLHIAASLSLVAIASGDSPSLVAR